MGHDHHHHHDDQNTYFMEQLCTIAMCGAFGGVAVMLWARGTLKLFLDPKFHPFVLAGGITLLALVAIRALAVWRQTGPAPHAHDHHEHDHAHEHTHHACAHDDGHEHDHTCAHGHDHAHEHTHACAHGHDHAHDHHHGHDHAHHDHDHAWNPWRYAVLLLPIVLFFMNLPNQAFSEDYMREIGLKGDMIQAGGHFSPDLGVQVEKDEATGLARVEKVNDDSPASREGLRPGDLIASVAGDAGDALATSEVSIDKILEKLQGQPGTKAVLAVRRQGSAKDETVTLVREGKVIPLEFKELERATFSEAQRDFYTGRRGRIKGQFSPSNSETGFTLVRLKMTCCAADVTPLRMWIEAPQTLRNLTLKPNDWVEVEGQIRFDQQGAGNRFIPVMQVLSMDKIQKTTPESDLFIQ